MLVECYWGIWRWAGEVAMGEIKLVKALKHLMTCWAKQGQSSKVRSFMAVLEKAIFGDQRLLELVVVSQGQ